MIDVWAYIWLRLPLILMFANGYLIYRLLVVTQLTDVFVYKSLSKTNGSVRLIFLYIIGAAALLSFFIPNTITVLTLLPVLKTLRQDMKNLTTPLTLSVIYGANIGGMGSLIGSPANLLLIGELDIYQVADRSQITFFNWFLWAVPLVVLLAFAAWLVIILFVSKSQHPVYITHTHSADLSHQQKYGLKLFGMFFFILDN